MYSTVQHAAVGMGMGGNWVVESTQRGRQMLRCSVLYTMHCIIQCVCTIMHYMLCNTTLQYNNGFDPVHTIIKRGSNPIAWVVRWDCWTLNSHCPWFLSSKRSGFHSSVSGWLEAVLVCWHPSRPSVTVDGTRSKQSRINYFSLIVEQLSTKPDICLFCSTK